MKAMMMGVKIHKTGKAVLCWLLVTWEIQGQDTWWGFERPIEPEKTEIGYLVEMGTRVLN